MSTRSQRNEVRKQEGSRPPGWEMDVRCMFCHKVITRVNGFVALRALQKLAATGGVSLKCRYCHTVYPSKKRQFGP